MALTITQGPLPDNGTRVDPSSFLEDWISQTLVFGLDAGSFKGGTLNFIASSTDPPSIAERNRGLMWFKRGEGRLFVYDDPCSPSNAAADLTNFISISDRRDIWVKALDPESVIPGQNLQIAQSGVSLTEIKPSFAGGFPEHPPFRVHWAVTAFNSRGHTGNDNNTSNNRLTEMCFVALESAGSGTLFRAVEAGFCNVYMACGETGIAGPLLVNENESETQWYIREEPHTQFGSTTGNMYLAFATDSSATNPLTAWTRPAFKFPLPPIGTSRAL